MTSARVELTGVRFSYQRGDLIGVECPSLAIGPGMLLVLGPNGAGKSTLLKIIAGVEMPDRGTVRIEGHDLWTDEVAARRRLVYLPEQPDVTPYATVVEVVRLAAAARGLAPNDALRQLARVGLDGVAQRTVRELSMGQRRRILLAAALLGEPEVLILDEPLETMDRPTRELVIGWAAGAAKRGATVLVATHELEPFLDAATEVLVVSAGSVRRESLPLDPTDRRAACERFARGTVDS